MKTDQNQHNIEEILLANPATSHWLKQAIKDLSNRDIVDSLHDLDALKAVLDERYNNLIRKHM